MGRQAALAAALGIGAAIAAAAASAALATPALALPALPVKLVGMTEEIGYPAAGFVRTSNGVLHVAYETRLAWGNGSDGVATNTISPTGQVGSPVQIVSGWDTDVPALLAGGRNSLAAFWGGDLTDDSTGSNTGPWESTSSNGGASWSGYSDVGSHTGEPSVNQLTAQWSHGTPFFTIPQAGTLTTQLGFGTGAMTTAVPTPNDGDLGNVDSAVDASTGAVIGAWYSIYGAGGLWWQQLEPSLGVAVRLPNPTNFTGQQQVIAGRDQGPGVFGAYTPNRQRQVVRLARYGLHAFTVGRVRELPASLLGVATGIHGRIWVMWWGTDVNGTQEIVLTRSNMAVTKFEPLQRFRLSATFMWRLYGDGRRGPLDLLLNEMPATGRHPVEGVYYARVKPILSAGWWVRVIKNGSGRVIGYTMSVRVGDAGDPVVGAVATVRHISAKTGANGIATLHLPTSLSAKDTLTVTGRNYQVFRQTIGR